MFLSRFVGVRTLALAAFLFGCLVLAQSKAPQECAAQKKAMHGKGIREYKDKLGKSVVLVDREQLRIKKGKIFHLPVLKQERAKLPPIPTTPVDWTNNGNTAVVPLLGNDQYGDCYAAAGCHWFSLSSYRGGKSKADTFDQQTLINWYLQESGGDNGLSDSDVLPKMEAGWIPAPGDASHKTLDYLIVDTSNVSNIQLGMYLFGPAIWTCSLEDTWLNNMGPNANWTNDGTPDPSAGHAMVLGKVAPGSDPVFSTATWGYYNTVTYSGIKAADSEIVLCFSLEWFNSSGYAPNGIHYADLANYWVAVGGKSLPPNPFPAPAPPAPTPTPTPVPTPTPAPAIVVVSPKGDTFALPAGWTIQQGFGASVPAVQSDLTAKGINPNIINAIIALLEELLGITPTKK